MLSSNLKKIHGDFRAKIVREYRILQDYFSFYVENISEETPLEEFFILLGKTSARLHQWNKIEELFTQALGQRYMGSADARKLKDFYRKQTVLIQQAIDYKLRRDYERGSAQKHPSNP